jgi:predicted amidohydrolase
MRVGLCQMRSGVDRDANVAAATELVRAAAGEGATLVATPEMTTLLDRNPHRLFRSLPDEDEWRDAEHAAFAALANELGIHLLIGSMAVGVQVEGRTKLANRSVLFGPGGAIARYDKIHLFDVDLPTGESWRESATVAGGGEGVVADIGAAKLGLTICYDVRFPHLYRQLAQAGAEILAVPAAFTVPTGEAHWATLLRARAIETGAFVIAPAQGGEHEDGRKTYGHSMVIDPWGRVLACREGDTPGILLADLDLAAVADARARIPSLALDRPFAVRIY